MQECLQFGNAIFGGDFWWRGCQNKQAGLRFEHVLDVLNILYVLNNARYSKLQTSKLKLCKHSTALRGEQVKKFVF